MPEQQLVSDDNSSPCEVITDQPKEPRFYGKTLQAAKLVVEHGVEPKTALMLASGNEPHRSTVRLFKEKVSKYALSRPSMVKKAFQAVQETLDMKPIELKDGKQIFPSHTNRLAAAAMIVDRVEPIVKVNQNVNINVDISPVDLDRYR